MFSVNTLEKLNPLWLFVPLFLVWAFGGYISTTVWASSYWHYVNLNGALLRTLYVICLIFNIFVYKIYNWKKFIIHLLITLLIVVVACHNKLFSLLYLWFFLLSIHPISFKKIAKVVLIFTSIAVFIVVLLTTLGYGENIIFERLGWMCFYRYSFGFLDPNTFSAYLFQICMSLVYLRWKDFGSKDNLFLFAIFCLVTFFANSRTTSVLLVLLMLLVNFSRFWGEISLKINYIAAKILFVLCPVFSFLIAKLYGYGIPLALSIDGLLSCRLRNMCFCMATYPLSFWGNTILVKYDMHVLANLYGILLIKYGICIFLLFLASYFLMIRKTYLHKDIPLMIILVLTLVQAVSEQFFLIPYINFTILAFSALLNNNCLFTKQDFEV